VLAGRVAGQGPDPLHTHSMAGPQPHSTATDPRVFGRVRVPRPWLLPLRRGDAAADPAAALSGVDPDIRALVLHMIQLDPGQYDT
jgi:hypothetical protein